ncbi:MAG: Polyketide cyclase/dehydrase [Frankiales bacterium]|nr:Polyketide cyclase/dehydrase [Frankiales bacterium]
MDIVSVERVIPAPAAEIFALIADPHRHQDFDGSGTVRSAKDVPSGKLKLGSSFGMSMKLGVPYSMVSTVVEFEQDKRLAWQTLPPYPLVKKVTGGRIWRYELEPVEGGTLVRESWDISKEGVLSKPAVKMAAETTRKNMAATLERIEQVLCSS